jgi:hypothetical protein
LNSVDVTSKPKPSGKGSVRRGGKVMWKRRLWEIYAPNRGTRSQRLEFLKW